MELVSDGIHNFWGLMFEYLIHNYINMDAHQFSPLE